MTSDASQSPRLRLCRTAFALTVLLPLCFTSLHPIRPSALQLAPPQQRFLDHFVAAAVERTHHAVRYDPAYFRIPYPGGDVPAAPTSTTAACQISWSFSAATGRHFQSPRTRWIMVRAIL